ncbi:hypothetical protein D3C76_1565690 [compost metagenome]
MFNDLGTRHRHNVLQQIIMPFTGTNRTYDTINDEDIVWVHFVLGKLAPYRLTKQSGRNKRPSFHRTDATGDNGFRFSDTRHAPKANHLIAFPFKYFTQKVHE